MQPRTKIALIAVVFTLIAFASISAGPVEAIVSQPTITGVVVSIQNYTIFLQGYEQGFRLAAVSRLPEGVSPSSINGLIGKSVTMTYRSVNGGNIILTLVVNTQ